MIPEHIFRAYDIRGVYGVDLTEEIASRIGRAVSTYLNGEGKHVVVGRDVRLSGGSLEDALIRGLLSGGCDIEEIGAIAEAHDLYLIEDAAHALGAEYAGKKVGTFADITMFSFHPVKHITTGEGGMCGTDDEELSRRMRILRNQGADTGARERFGPSASWAYDVKLLGRNYRMTDFQAALGLSQMKKLDGRIKRRQELADKYSKGLKNTPLITLPCTKPNVKHVWHLYTILLDRKIDREKFIAAMRAKNIGVSVHYCPVYRFSYYKKNFDFRPADFPVTEDVSSRIVTLPLFPKMSDKDVNDVVTAVEESIEALVK